MHITYYEFKVSDKYSTDFSFNLSYTAYTRT